MTIRDTNLVEGKTECYLVNVYLPYECEENTVVDFNADISKKSVLGNIL